MPNIRVDTSYTVKDGSEVVFTAPCNCSEIDGLKVYYPDGEKEFVFKDAHGNALTGIGEAFAEGALVKTILDVTKGFAYIQNADTNSYIEGTFVKKNPPVLTATPDTLADVMASAQAGATIQLTAGDYPLLTFTGEYGLARAETDNPLQGTVLKYPENLTIIGEPGVKIAGISITSGVMDNELTNTTVLEKMRLPGNLTIKSSSANSGNKLTTVDMCITDNVCLRNCVIDGLHIENCYFTHGGIQLNPDSFKDYYGADTASIADTVWHRQWAKPLISNVVIKGNRFGEAGDYGTEASAVNARCVNNLDVRSNYIDYTPFGGVIVHGQSDYFSTGRIGIIDNVVRNGGVQGIHVADLRDAELFVHTNRLFNQEEVRKASILISDCVNTKYAFAEYGGSYNKYNSAVITVENGGIIIENDHPAPENAAPAGYGLGTTDMRWRDSTTINSTVLSGWYHYYELQTRLCNVTFNHANLFVYYYDFEATSCVQELRPIGTNVVLRRCLDKGTWTEWEIENPPMDLSVEYRTTEHWNGKAVYKKLINFGAFPQSASREVSTGISAGKYHIVGVHRHAKETSTNADIMFLAHLTYEYIFVHNGTYHIHVSTNGAQKVTAYYLIEYVEV